MAKNCEMKFDAKANKLVITIDTKKDFGKSGSGKSIIIASTEGNVSVEGSDGIKVGLNVYRSAKPE